MVGLRACGARPSAGARPTVDRLAGSGPEMARGVNFADGCAPRVPRDRLDACRSMASRDIESLAPARGAIFFLDRERTLEIYLVRVGGL
jgi:hypothetical protein